MSGIGAEYEGGGDPGNPHHLETGEGMTDLQEIANAAVEAARNALLGNAYNAAQPSNADVARLAAALVPYVNGDPR
jgi:Flp pilus assembly protein TadG